MQSDLEILLKLLAGGKDLREGYLPTSVMGRVFDLGGLFEPKCPQDVICFIGQRIVIEGSKQWDASEQELAHQLCSMLWMLSEYGGDVLPSAVLGKDAGEFYYHKGLCLVIERLAERIMQCRGYDSSPPNRGFDEVFMKDSIQRR